MDKINSVMNSMIDKCLVKMREPYIDCKEKFDLAYKKCRKKMKVLKSTCKIVKAVKPMCKLARASEAICLLGRFAKEGVGMMGEMIISQLDWIKDQFYFRISFKRHYSLNTTLDSKISTRSFKDKLKPKIKFMLSFKSIFVLIIELYDLIWLVLIIVK